MAPSKDLILAVNAGSSSLKISLFRREPSSSSSAVSLVLTSSLSSLSAPPATFAFAFADPHKAAQNVKSEKVEGVADHAAAFAHFLERLEKDASVRKDDVARACHRVVHGGDYAAPVVISKDTYHHIEKLTDLAPLSVAPSLFPCTRLTARFDSQAQWRRARGDPRDARAPP
jgi:acetate kinase